MTTLRVVVPAPQWMGLNSMRSARHWSEVRDWLANTQETFRFHLRPVIAQHDDKPSRARPLSVRLDYVQHTRQRRDVDGLALHAKAALDALVTLQFVDDDDFTRVRELTQAIRHDEHATRTHIELELNW